MYWLGGSTLGRGLRSLIAASCLHGGLLISVKLLLSVYLSELRSAHVCFLFKYEKVSCLNTQSTCLQCDKMQLSAVSLFSLLLAVNILQMYRMVFAWFQTPDCQQVT